MRLAVVAMGLDDVSQVLEVDRESYSLPWPASAYRREILHNRNAHYFVLRQVSDSDGRPAQEPQPRVKLPLPFLRWPLRSEHQDEQGDPILGYAGMWMMIDESHITTIAVREKWRGQGLGELLLASLLESAWQLGAARVTLEVRVSNESAQSLYRKYGFKQEGVRPRYYSDNNEDAYIMTTGDIRDPDYRQQFGHLVERLRRRLVDGREVLVAAPAFGERIRSSFERERDGHANSED